LVLRLHRAACHRRCKREHPRGTPKPHWGIVNNPPAPGVNPHGLPGAVAEVEVDLVADLGNAHVHDAITKEEAAALTRHLQRIKEEMLANSGNVRTSQCHPSATT